MSTATEFGRGKTIFVLAIVIGCFAVLWPKIFYPMLTASISQTNGEDVPVPVVVPRPRKGWSSTCCDVISEKDTNAYKVMNELCTSIIRKEQMIQQQQQAQQPKPKKASQVKVPTVSLCRNIIMQTCGVDIIGLLKEDHSITTEYKKSLGQLRTFNTSLCMKMNFGVDFTEIGLPRKFKGPETIREIRQERPFRPGPEMIHPALRERGRGIPTVSIPRRTIEREARPGPVPGMRPPVGGAGHIPTGLGPKGGGTMGIIMPMYTIGIVCFFLYTIMKILFKKSPEPEQVKQPQVKDYGLDPEHRKYVFSEEYVEGSERSLKETYTKEDMGLRRRPSAGKSTRFYEDRRRLETPSIIYPTYPSNLETNDPPETTTSTLTSSLSVETDAPATKEYIENESSSSTSPTAAITTAVISLADAEDAKKTDISAQSPPQSETVQTETKFQEGIEQPTSVLSPSDASLDVPISHDEPDTNNVRLHDDVDSERKNATVEQPAVNIIAQKETEIPLRKDDKTDQQEQLSRNASTASSADTIIAEATAMSEIEPLAATTSVENDSSGTSPSNSTAVKKQSSVVSPSEMGPFSPLAPDQTPNLEYEEFHFFDRTIVIPDYEPADPSKLSQDQEAANEAAVEDTPEITIVKQENVPQNVLDMADQVAEQILDAAKSESVASVGGEETEEIPGVAAPTPSPAGETLMMTSLTDDDTASASIVPPTEPAPDYSSLSLQQPRLSLDTSITTAVLEVATNADVMHESTNIPPPTETLSTSSPSEPSATNVPPEIQVETPHADQTELNRIAEYLETLNTEPKEIEKLAAVVTPTSPTLGEMGPISPIVTLAEEIKESPDIATSSCAGQTATQSSGSGISGKSKIEITPFEDTQTPSPLEKLGFGDLPDICYVTQPLDESQKGRDRAQFLRSRVEIVSIDESLPISEPTTALPVEKGRKASEPASLGESSSAVTESLEDAMKKLRHVSGESTTSEEKDRKSLRKASTASDHSQVDSPKPSEIDKYVDRLANMQESRKAMIEREMFRSSRSTQGSDTDQQADQSSNFHGPGLLDSGQIPEIESHHHPPDFPPPSEGSEDDFLDKMKEVERWATSTSAVKASQDSNDDDNIYSLPLLTGSGYPVPASSVVNYENDDNKNEKLMLQESMEKVEPGTVIVELSSTPRSLLEGAIKIATFVIDQALRDGIQEAVKIIIIEKEKNNRLSDIDKLDQVLEEIGYGNGGSSIEILSPVSKTELNSENLEDELLKSLKEGQMQGNNLTGVGTAKYNLDDNNLRTDRVINLTGNDTQTANQAETQLQIEPIITPITSTSMHTNNAATQDTERSAKYNDSIMNLTSLAGESNLNIQKITEECEISSAATTSAEAFNTPPTTAPTTVESCLPSESASFLPTDSITTPPVPVVDPQEQKSESLEEAQQEIAKTAEGTDILPTEELQKEENQEPILAELETIQEEIENLSSELDKMEVAITPEEDVKNAEAAQANENAVPVECILQEAAPVEQKVETSVDTVSKSEAAPLEKVQQTSIEKTISNEFTTTAESTPKEQVVASTDSLSSENVELSGKASAPVEPPTEQLPEQIATQTSTVAVESAPKVELLGEENLQQIVTSATEEPKGDTIPAEPHQDDFIAKDKKVEVEKVEHELSPDEQKETNAPAVVFDIHAEPQQLEPKPIADSLVDDEKREKVPTDELIQVKASEHEIAEKPNSQSEQTTAPQTNIQQKSDVTPTVEETLQAPVNEEECIQSKTGGVEAALAEHVAVQAPSGENVPEPQAQNSQQLPTVNVVEKTTTEDSSNASTEDIPPVPISDELLPKPKEELETSQPTTEEVSDKVSEVAAKPSFEEPSPQVSGDNISKVTEIEPVPKPLAEGAILTPTIQDIDSISAEEKIVTSKDDISPIPTEEVESTPPAATVLKPTIEETPASAAHKEEETVLTPPASKPDESMLTETIDYVQVPQIDSVVPEIQSKPIEQLPASELLQQVGKEPTEVAENDNLPSSPEQAHELSSQKIDEPLTDQVDKPLPQQAEEHFPTKDETLLQKVDNLSSPKAEEISPPKAEKISPPKAEEISPPKAEEITPLKAEEITPLKAEEISSPKTEEILPPKYEILSPTTQEISSPKAEAISTPTTEEISSPKVEEISPPKAEEISSPKTEEILPPKGEEISPPKVEEILPSKVEEILPSKVEEILPSKVEEILPSKVEEISLPKVEEISAPKDEISSPLAEVISPSKVEEILFPKSEESSSPKSEEISLPKAEETVSESKLSLKETTFSKEPTVSTPKLTEESTKAVAAETLIAQENKAEPLSLHSAVEESSDVKPQESAEQQQMEPILSDQTAMPSQSTSIEETKPTPPVVEPVQTAETLPVVATTPLRFETLTEPRFPIPSTTTSITSLSQPEQNTFKDNDSSENNKITDSSPSLLSPNTNTAVSSCGLVVDSSNLTDQPPPPSGASMALTVELLDENSPEIFPLPSTNITTTTTIASESTFTSPVEKAQLDQSEKEKLVNAGVSLSAATDQASSATITTTATTPTTRIIEVTTAEKQATQASSALSDTCPTTTTDQGPPKESTHFDDKILSSSEIITDESSNVPSSPPPPPTTPVVSSQPPSFPISSKQDVIPPQPEQRVERKDEDDQANKESGHRERDARDVEIDMLRKRLEETEAAMERIVSQMGSVTDQLSPSVLAQVLKTRGEDLEKLIASAEKSAARKEDLGAAEAAPSKAEAQTPPSAVAKPATREKREKSSEKEVKFKLPPEEMEVEEEEEIEEEEEVEIVRPPTPPKTLSKAKTKSPPPTPEPSGSATNFTPLASSSSHRAHDELLISSMQTTVAGSAADTSIDNQSKSPSPAALIADYYNNATSKTITPTISDTPTFLHPSSSPQPLPSLVESNEAKERTISETVTILDNRDDNNKQSAAIAQAKAGVSSPSPTSGVSVIGIEETASLITGERWDISRTPTPTFRNPTPPVPHRPPSPPDTIPSIYLEGPMPSRGHEIVVREAQIEVEGGDDYDYDDDYEPSGPVILSGKVTLSVISSAGGNALSHDEITDATSLSLDDRAQAEHSRGRGGAAGASSKGSVAAQIASAMNEQVRGKSDGKKSSNASSPDMDEYEVIGKGGFGHEVDEDADVSLEDFLTATDADQEGEKAQEDTAGDISIMDDLKQELLPKDEE